MEDKKLDEFLANRTPLAMKRIEEEIYKEVRAGVCEYFNIDSIRKLNDAQIKQIKKPKKLVKRVFETWIQFSSETAKKDFMNRIFSLFAVILIGFIRSLARM